MGWERRKNRQYYYYKRRDGDRVISQYAGAGAAAQAIAALQTNDTRLHAGLRARRAPRAPDPLAGRLDTLAVVTRNLTRAVLEANGYHAHKGQWRKSRMPRASKALAVAPADLAAPRPGQDTAAWLNELLTRPQLTPAERAALVEAFDHLPTIRQQVGDLVTHARAGLIGLSAGQGAGVRVAIEREVDALIAGLGYATAAPLERLLIDQIACCWLNVYDVQRRYASVMSESQTIKHAEYWERKHTAAQHRYLRAIEALARVRKLARPGPLQINIGDKQINMVNPPGPAPALVEMSCAPAEPMAG